MDPGMKRFKGIIDFMNAEDWSVIHEDLRILKSNQCTARLD
jgi:hypothetical protein